MDLIVLRTEMPTLNQYIDACRRNRYSAASLKRKVEQGLCLEFMKARVGKFDQSLDLGYVWYCRNMKTDKSNIAFCAKFVEDAMVKVGIIPNDGWKHIGSFSHDFMVDKADPRLELTISCD